MKKLVIISSLLFSLLMIVLVSSSFLVSASYCLVTVGDEYTCYESDSYAQALGSPYFEEYCGSTLGGTYSTDDALPDQCIIGCCCGNTNEGTFTTLTPVSKNNCDLSSGSYSFHQTDDDTSDCDEVCDYDEWSPEEANTYDIQGTVIDENSNPVDSVTIHYPSRNSDIVTASDDDGRFYLSNILEGDVSIFFEHPDCLIHTEPVSLTENIDDLSVTIDCSRSSCVPEAVNSLVVSVDAGTPNVSLSWSEPTDYCPQLSVYKIYACDSNDEGDSCTGVGVVNPGVNDFTSVVKEEDFDKQICYRVNAVYTDDNSEQQEVEMVLPDSKTNCVGPFNDYCLTNKIDDSRPFCINEEGIVYVDNGDLVGPTNTNGVFQCENNVLYLNHNCSVNQVCYSGECVNPSKCDLCNGLYGSFVNSLAKIWGTRTCSELNDCYLDNNGLSYDSYQHCGLISSCYDYNSKSACEGSAGDGDVCGLNQGCEWHPSSSNEADDINELGFGACVPTQPKVEDGVIDYECDLCDEKFPVCTPDSCSWLGGSNGVSDSGVGANNCYFVEESARVPGGPSCVSEKEGICEYYSQEDCGGSSLVVDASYDTDSDGSYIRVSGTNNIFTRSSDALGLGLCKWDPNANDNQGACLKDADGNSDLTHESDCEENDLGDDYDCLHDYEPPTTFLPFVNMTYLTESELSNSEPIVVDNVYHYSYEINTYACIQEVSSATESATCYPSNTNDYLWPNDLDFTEEGKGLYSINYYSEDPAGNIEPVKEIKVYVYALSDAKLISADILGSN